MNRYYEALNKFLVLVFGVMLIRKKSHHHYVPDIYGHAHGKLNDILQDKVFKATADMAMQGRKTFLYYDRLYTLYQALKNIREESPVIVEAGVYKGGSSYFLADLSQKLLI